MSVYDGPDRGLCKLSFNRIHSFRLVTGASYPCAHCVVLVLFTLHISLPLKDDLESREQANSRARTY